MKGSGKLTPKDRWGQVRVAKRRERRRLRRAGKMYGGLEIDRSIYSPATNPNYLAPKKAKYRGTRRIDLPAALDCNTPAEWSDLAALLGSIRRAALEEHLRRVVLNFHDVKSMSPEAATAIVAEIQRCEAYCDPRTEITGTYPGSPQVASLLCEVGFFKALDIREPKAPKGFKDRTYLQIERGNSVDSDKADELLNCFSEVSAFTAPDRRRLYVAILECMDNVFEHAYPLNSTAPHLVREWWLLGYSDRSAGTIRFIFYDQGAGIPDTIRQRLKHRVRAALQGWSDGQWIGRAVTRGMSRHASKRRGHGLRRLRDFVSEGTLNGTLKVVANRGHVEASSAGRTRISNITNELHGTIVVWELKDLGGPTSPQEMSGD